MVESSPAVAHRPRSLRRAFEACRLIVLNLSDRVNGLHGFRGPEMRLQLRPMPAPSLGPVRPVKSLKPEESSPLRLTRAWHIFCNFFNFDALGDWRSGH